MKSILITGCNRGIGLGLVNKLASLPNAPVNIFATCRDISKATALTDIANQSKNVDIFQIDLKNTNELDSLVKHVQDKLGGNGLNVIFNNAGIATKFHRLNLVKEQDLLDLFHINTVAPILLTKAFLPLLKKASSDAKDQPLGTSRAAIINMSSTLGSITDNTTGGYYPYRCSKAAINIATKSMSVDLKNDGILATCLHPGWVKTEMGGPNALITVDQCVDGIVKLLQSLNESHNGAFLDYTGKKMDW